MPLKVELQAGLHSLLSQEIEELLDEGWALTVGYPVIEHLSLAGVLNVLADRMRRTETVPGDAPELVLEKCDPT